MVFFSNCQQSADVVGYFQIPPFFQQTCFYVFFNSVLRMVARISIKIAARELPYRAQSLVRLPQPFIDMVVHMESPLSHEHCT